MISNENKLKDLIARKEIMLKTVQEVENGVVAQTVDMTRESYDAEILGTVPYLTTQAVIMISISGKLNPQIATMHSSYLDNSIRPVVIIHRPSLVRCVINFGPEFMCDMLPFIVAHELRHYGQILEGICVMYEYHEVDADSVAIADSGVPVDVYMRLPELLYFSLTGEEYNPYTGNAAMYEIFERRVADALAMYKGETDLPGATESYEKASDMIMAAIEYPSNTKKASNNKNSGKSLVKIAAAMLATTAIGALAFNKRR